MARKINIGHSFAWHRYETKQFRIIIRDDDNEPVDLSGLDLEWQVLPYHKATTPTFVRSADEFETPETYPGDSVPAIAVWDVTDAESGALESGWYYYYLYDRTNDALLLHGGIILLPGVAVAV